MSGPRSDGLKIAGWAGCWLEFTVLAGASVPPNGRLSPARRSVPARRPRHRCSVPGRQAVRAAARSPRPPGPERLPPLRPAPGTARITAAPATRPPSSLACSPTSRWATVGRRRLRGSRPRTAMAAGLHVPREPLRHRTGGPPLYCSSRACASRARRGRRAQRRRGREDVLRRGAPPAREPPEPRASTAREEECPPAAMEEGSCAAWRPR